MTPETDQMNWKNASEDTSPHHNQFVLISVNGIYYVAKFDARVGTFQVKDNLGPIFRTGKQIIYWAELNEPANADHIISLLSRP